MRTCYIRNVSIVSRRTYKNFGHQRESIPGVTTLWHGFLTFSFIGMGLNWNWIGTWIYGEDFAKKDQFDFEDDESS